MNPLNVVKASSLSRKIKANCAHVYFIVFSSISLRLLGSLMLD